jgi:hypothetical protein
VRDTPSSRASVLVGPPTGDAVHLCHLARTFLLSPTSADTRENDQIRPEKREVSGSPPVSAYCESLPIGRE